MSSERVSQFQKLKFALFVLVVIWLAGMTIWWNNPDSVFERLKAPGLPFGFLRYPGGGIEVQDFAYNLVFFRGIRDRVVAHPYRMADQEVLVRKLVPAMTKGMTHGYSPVAFVLSLPLMQMTGAQANLLYDALASAGIAALFYLYLLPRAAHSVQLLALGLVTVSICLVLTMALSQTSLLTTPLLGLFWVLLQQREESRSGKIDLILGLVFWALCLKPNIGLIALILLFGTKAWRPVVLGFALLALTWVATGPLYGGWISGLRDYAFLLDHYNNADFIPFMQRDYVPGHDAEIRGLFTFDRTATIVCSLILLAQHWAGRISLSALFQGMIATFLLLSPYLLPSEDLILFLLIVENDFFKEPNPLAALGKLFLLFGIMDLRGGVIVPFECHFQFKCLFFIWMFGEQLFRRRAISAA